MSIAAVGSEILVNTTTTGPQYHQKVAGLTNGGFVVTWTDESALVGDTSYGAVRAQLFDAAGAPVGAEFLVNTSTFDTQGYAKVTALSGGGFAVSWDDYGGDGSGSGIRAQVFDAAGAPVGSEIQVNTTTAGYQYGGPIVALSNGGFVVTWQDTGASVGDTYGGAVRAQVFDAAGAPVGLEILVNTTTEGNQDAPASVALSNGGFVVAWQQGPSGAGGDGSGSSVRAQVFDAGGAPLGAEIRVNTTIAGDQFEGEVTALENGGFVIAWTDFSHTGGDTAGYAVRAQVFDAAGAPVGTEILVNTTTQGSQYTPAITALSGGGFVVSWQDDSIDGNGEGVNAQVFDASGGRVGGEIRVNTTTALDQSGSQLLALPDGGFVVVWNDTSATGGDTSGDAVRLRQFAPDGTALGSEVLVNSTTLGRQTDPRIVDLGNGKFAVTWADWGASAGDTDDAAVRAQVFTVGPEPTLWGLGGSAAFVEGAGPVAVAPGLLLSDPDSAGLTSGQVQITGNLRPGEDVLALPATAGIGDIVAGGYNAATGLLTLTSAGGATLAQWQTALRAVTYGNSSATPDGVGRTLTYRVNDGAHDSVAQTRTLGVTAVNSPPTGADATRTLVEGGSKVLNAADFGFSDVEGHTLSAVKITTLPGAGTLKLDGVAVTAGQVVTAADLAANKLVFAPAANANGTGYASFTFQVQDNGGTANGGVDTDPTPNTLTFDVSRVNDAPAGADATKTLNEDEPRTLNAADFGFSDADGDTLSAVKITTLPGAGTLKLDGVAVTAGQVVTAADLAANKLVFAPAANANGTGYASFTFQVQDNGGTANGGVDTDPTPNTLTFDVASVNDAPTGADATRTLVEGGSKVLNAADFGFSDVEGHTLSAVKITTLPGAGTLKLDGVAVTAGQVVTAADLAANKLVFAPAANGSGTGYASFTFQVQDNGGTANGGVDTDPTPNTLTFDVSRVNDAPAGADATKTLNEDEPRTLNAADFGFSDADGDTLSAVKITTLPGAGTLKLDGVAVTAGQVVTAADLAANKLVFAPAANANGTGYASFTFQVQDNGGTANGGVDTDPTPNTLTFDVEAVNDPAVLGGGGGAAAYTVGGSSIAVATGVTVADIEDHVTRARVTLVDGYYFNQDRLAFTPTPQTGDITAAFDDDIGSLVLSAGSGGATAAQMQAALRAVTYVNTSASPNLSARTFEIRVDDGDGYSTAVTTTLTLSPAPPAPPAPPPPAPDPGVTNVVDGMPVTTIMATDADGQVTRTLVVPLVTSSRIDTVGGNTLADVPLAPGLAGGPPALSAQIPVGFGLTAIGATTPRTAGASLSELIREIQGHTVAGSGVQAQLTGAGGDFLASLPASTPLLVQTLSPTGGGGAGSEPLIINGQAPAAGTATIALVLDARGLAEGTPLALHNVAFATVIGAATVIGGDGSQTVWGDGASQYLFLGADNDVLHGGGGADTVASAGGDDQLYGDDGDDSVSGGIGDDFVHGNAGSDTVSGGEGNDRAYGGRGNDRVTGDSGDDMVFGDLGDDFLHGNAGSDTVDGGAGNDTVHGGQGSDQLTGGEGDDVVLGDAGNDLVQGAQGDDIVSGGDGDDIVHGGQGDDVVLGGAGDDWLSGDRGNDTLTGGAGADTFHAYAGCGIDIVTDFNAAEGDRVLLDPGTPFAVKEISEGVLINIGLDNYMLLQGVQLSSLGDGWLLGG